MPHPTPSRVVPYLVTRDAAAALVFYVRVFGAVEQFRMTDPGDGRLGHAEILIGPSLVMLSDEYPDFGAFSPDTIGGTAVTLQVQVDDTDAVLAPAQAAGALILRAAADQSFGERVGVFQDPFGHRWMISQRIEEVTPAEMQHRWEQETGA
jgi:PhnB protein